jgi:hypothetical protein
MKRNKEDKIENEEKQQEKTKTHTNLNFFCKIYGLIFVKKNCRGQKEKGKRQRRASCVPTSGTIGGCVREALGSRRSGTSVSEE